MPGVRGSEFTALGRQVTFFRNTDMFKKILNPPEETTYGRLREACSRNGAQVFAKIRMADVLLIEGSGISDELYRFALQSHFDFLISDLTPMPLFAVEFDGVSHERAVQAARDSKKGALCTHFQLPMLRINAEFINRKYRELDLLTWFVESWFLSKAFDEAQAEGNVSPYEPFDPCMFVTLPGFHGFFPLWLSAEPRLRIQKLFLSGKCVDSCPSVIIGRDDDNIYRAIAFIKINKDEGVYVTTAMRSQSFPILDSSFQDLLY